MGARSMGMGHASSCLDDPWALFNNAAGLAKVNKSSAGFSFASYPEFDPFNRIAAVIAMPTSRGCVAMGIYKHGDDIYSENIASLAFGNTMGISSLGLKASLVNYRADGLGSTTVVAISFGGITTLTPDFSIGAHVININQPTLTRDGERLPTFFILGISLVASDQFRFAWEVEKDMAFPLTWKTGIEYRLKDTFAARLGVNVSPGAAFTGFRFRMRRLTLEYAARYQLTLGLSHQATVMYSFQPR